MTPQEQIILAGSIPSSFYDDKEFANTAQEALEAAVAKVGLKANAKDMIQNAQKETAGGKYRKQLLERVADLPKDIVAGLLNKRKQLNDTILFEMAVVTGKTIRIVKTDGGKAVGIRNLSNGKHDKYFLCSAVRLLVGAGGALGYDNNFSGQNYSADIENGNITIKANDKVILNEMQIANFKSYTGDADERKAGLYELNNPKWIYPDTEIKMDIEMPYYANLPNTWVKVMLIGTEIIDF